MYCKLHKKHHLHHHHGCVGRSPSSDSSSTSSSEPELNSHTEIFKRKAEIIKMYRSTIKKKFPKEIWVPHKNDLEWCSFCLGPKICKEIYGEITKGEKALCYRRLPYRRFPLLSIIIHLHQEKVKLLLNFLHQWFLMKGLKNLISMWMYALLACLDVDDECDQLLKNLYKDCKKYLKSCEPWQKPRATLIMDILKYNFSVDTLDSDSE